jgi:AcrR family transcriptional regulator
MAERSAPARERLMRTALQRFAAEDPVAVRLDDVRREAGVSVGALYHHFADKADLLEALYLELTTSFQSGFLTALRAEPTAERGIKTGVRFYLRWVSRNRAGARLLFGHRPDSPALRELNREFLRAVRAWWDVHVHYGVLRPMPLALVHALWLGPAHEYTRGWLDDAGRRSPSSVAELLGEAAWSALKEEER